MTIRYSLALRIRMMVYLWRELVAQFFELYMQKNGLMMLASKFNYATSLEKARMDAITTAVGNAGKLFIYRTAQPAGPDNAAGTTIAGPFTLGSPFAPGATSALPSVLSPTLPSNINASDSNQPVWFRVTTAAGSNGSVGLIDGSALSAGGDMTIGPTTTGQPVAITAWTQSSATYGH